MTIYKKAIATPKGQPTKYVDMTQAEIDARNAEIALAEAEALANAPYVRLAELDALINAKSARIIEDLALGNPAHTDVVSLFNEKHTIRDRLKSNTK